MPTALMINENCYGHLEFFSDDEKGLQEAKARFKELVKFFRSQASRQSQDDPNYWLDQLHIDRVELGAGQNYWSSSDSIIFSFCDLENDTDDTDE